MKNTVIFFFLLIFAGAPYIYSYPLDDTSLGIHLDFPEHGRIGKITNEVSEKSTTYRYTTQSEVRHYYCGVDGIYFPVYSFTVAPLNQESNFGDDEDSLARLVNDDIYERLGYKLQSSSWGWTPELGYSYTYKYSEGQMSVTTTVLIVDGILYELKSVKTGQNRTVGDCGTLDYVNPDHTGYVRSFKLQRS